MKNIIILFLLPLIFLTTFQCKQKEKNTENDCENYGAKAAWLVQEYYMDSQKKHLDSALFYIDKIYGKCPKYHFALTIRKLQIYSLKPDLSKAIEFIKSLDTSLFMFSYNKNLLLYRFKAMQAQQSGNWDKKNFFLDKIISELTPIINKLNKKEIDSIISLPYVDSILYTKHYNPNLFKLIHYYYYKGQREGKDKIKIELDSFQNAIHGNNEFFNILRENLDKEFMTYEGI